MQINFDEIDSIGEYQPVPEGTYVCRVARVDEARSSRGDDMWKLRLEIEDGEHAGRVIFDRLVFSPRAMPRVKRICQCLGVRVEGQLELTADMLVGRRCQVRVLVGDYIDQDGEARTNNTVPYDGYEAAPDDDVPF